MDKTSITISRAARLTRLHPMPGQDPTKTYGVVSEGLPQPSDGLGYVVEIRNHRSVKIVAWIQRGVSLWAADAPLAAAPHRPPDLAFLRDDRDSTHGVVRLRRTGEVDVAHWTCASDSVRYSLDLSSRYIGRYAKPNPTLGIRTLAAVAWISLILVRPAFVDVLGMAGDLSSLSSTSLPDALDLLMRTKGMPSFRRFLAEDLLHAQAPQVRRICAGHVVEGVYLQATHLFWIRYDGNAVPPQDQRILAAVEAAVNRAILAASWLLEQDLGARHLDAALWSHAERHACLGLLQQAPGLFEASREDNPRHLVQGAKAARGGEWDVRTRFSLAIEYLRLPCRLDCRFDCDVNRGVFAIEFAAPGELELPEPRILDDVLHRGTLEPIELRRAYAVRLGLLLAATAFGTSVGITQCRVSAFDTTLDGDPIYVADVNRMDFAASALPTLRRFGSLASIDIADDLLRALELEEDLHWGGSDALQPLGLAARHLGVGENHAKLSERLAKLLRADYADELDVYGSVEDPELKEEASVLEENDDSPLIAIMELEGILASIDQDLDEHRVPLYCANGTDRLIVSLAPGDARNRYVMVRDATYAAKVQLSRLYLKLGDVVRALEAAEECVKLAPTSATAMVEYADLYARLDRYEEAVTYLTRALGLIVAPEEIPYVFYRLAFALWQTGKPQLALCGYTIAAQDDSLVEQTHREHEELMNQNPGLKQPTLEEAKTELAAAGMPYPVAPNTLTVLSEATLGLVDEGIFDPAWQALLTLAPTLGGDDLGAVLLSLKSGTPRTA